MQLAVSSQCERFTFVALRKLISVFTKTQNWDYREPDETIYLYL